MTPTTGSFVLYGYGVLLIIGGVLGYVLPEKPSIVSLIAGGGFGVLAIVSGVLISAGIARSGLILGGFVALLVLGAMGKRFMDSGKFMPAGMTAVLSLFVLVFVSVIVLRHTPGNPVRDPDVQLDDRP
jgi:uncharacterized membrane protein (UPF0136 family)